jgi:hypothetical protein
MNNAKQQRFSFTWCLVLLTMSACTTIPVDERDKVPFVGGGYVDHRIGSAAASKPDLSFGNDVSLMSKWSVFEPPRLAVELQKEGSSRRTWRNQ